MPGIPAVTVLMSCFNSARWLEQAITSMLEQTFEDYEFLIVDDGSTDDTLARLKHFSSLDRRVTVIEKPHTGLADSLNKGIEEARGKWIARIDADDVCEPNRLQAQIAFARSRPKLVFIGSGLTQIDAEGNPLKSYRYPTSHKSLVKHLETARRFPPHSSAFFLRETVRGIGGYRPRLQRAQDRDLWLRLAAAGELACLKQPLVKIRKHANQVSQEDNGRRQMRDSTMAVVSYFLRQQGLADPIGSSQFEFSDFQAWVEKRLSETGYFKYRHVKDELKKSLHMPDSYPQTAVKVTSVFIRSSTAIMILTERLAGSDLSRRLADEWASRSCAAS